MPRTAATKNQDPAQATDAGRTGNPTHRLYHIAEGRDDKSVWTPLAVAWENRDGSFNIRARSGAILLPGEDYQLRKIEPKAE